MIFPLTVMLPAVVVFCALRVMLLPEKEVGNVICPAVPVVIRVKIVVGTVTPFSVVRSNCPLASARRKSNVLKLRKPPSVK